MWYRVLDGLRPIRSEGLTIPFLHNCKCLHVSWSSSLLMKTIPLSYNTIRKIAIWKSVLRVLMTKVDRQTDRQTLWVTDRFVESGQCGTRHGFYPGLWRKPCVTLNSLSFRIRFALCWIHSQKCTALSMVFKSTETEFFST